MIISLCGFDNLNREERLKRADEILNNSELKQSICHQILGTTFKDVERAMNAIIKERQLTPDQIEELELKKIVPEKFEPEFDPDYEFRVNKSASDRSRDVGYTTYTMEEVAALLAASRAPHKAPKPTTLRIEYEILSREECERLVQEHYAYIERERNLKKERDTWGTTKMIASAPKIESTTKHTNSTKRSKR